MIYSDLQQDDTQDPQGLDWAAYRRDPRSNSANTLLYNTRKSVDQQQVGINYQQDLWTAQWQTTLYGGKRRVVQFLSIPRVVQQASATQAGGVVDFERDYYGLHSRWIQPWLVGPGELILTGGLDYDVSVDDRQGYENFVGDLLGVRGTLRRDERDEIRSLAPYLQLAWHGEQLNVQVGLRHNEVAFEVDDHYVVAGNGDDSGAVTYRELTPSVGAGYALPFGLTAYAGWSKASKRRPG